MIHSNDRIEARQFATQRPGNPWWFWLLLIGGSVALHLVLIYFANASTIRSRLNVAAGTVLTPVDFVKLPAAKTSVSSKIAASKRIAASSSQGSEVASRPPMSTTKVQAADSSGIQVALANKKAANAARNPKLEAVLPSPQSVSQVAPRLKQDTVTPSTASSSQTASPSLPENPAAPQPAVAANNRLDQAIASPIATPLPSVLPSPLLATQPIDVPIPDVSGTLSSPETDTPENLSANVTNQITIPSHLTASLTTATLPTEDSKYLLDAAAEPKTEVQTFSSNSAASPCMVTAEAVRFLGKTVAMQVATDETGKVIQIMTQESSQNPAYDELATCLVKNWGFEPAIARGEPVANDGLVVRITIDRS